MRKILQIDVDGHRLVGTHHEPEGDRADARRLGVLLLNVAQLPRSGMADLPVEIADRLAAMGTHAFRFDLPGLGDSPGALPTFVQEHWQLVEDGAHADLVPKIAAELAGRLDLEGVILGGLCGGAITSLYATEHDPSRVKGLIVLEPNYYLVGMAAPPPPGKAPAASSTPAGPARGFGHRLRWWLSTNRFGKRFIGLYRVANRLRLAVRGYRLPPDTNQRMVASSRRLAASGPPMLIIHAASEEKRRLLRKGVFKSLPRHHRLELTEIHGTNHMLVPGGGKQAVVERIDRWVRERFFSPLRG